MIDNETVRKASEIGIIDVVDAIKLIETNWYYVKKKCQLNRNFFYLTSTFEKC